MPARTVLVPERDQYQPIRRESDEVVNRRSFVHRCIGTARDAVRGFPRKAVEAARSGFGSSANVLEWCEGLQSRLVPKALGIPIA